MQPSLEWVDMENYSRIEKENKHIYEKLNSRTDLKSTKDQQLKMILYY